MKDVMMDIEALDSRRTAVVVSIGATYFDLHTQQLGEPFYVEIKKEGIQDQLKAGRTWSVGTLIWWMQQDYEARKVFLPTEIEKVGIIQALDEFATYLSKAGDKLRLWGNGVGYDNVVLSDCYETMGIKCPWSYRSDMCYRTMKALFKGQAKMTREGTHHNGLDDAITQAQHLMQMYSKLGG